MAGFKYDDPSTPHDVFNPAGGTGTASAPAPTAAAPAAPAGQIQTFAGYTPDYAGLIKSDPGYLAGQFATQAAQATAAAQRKAALQQAIVRYGGGLPANFKDQYGDIDQATLDAAKGNQQSTLANLSTNYAQSEQQFLRQLAARGALQSGDLNYGEDQLQRGYAQQQYDAANAVGDQATGALNSYTGVLNQNARDMAGAVNSAESNVYANPAYRQQSASYADYASAESSQYGYRQQSASYADYASAESSQYGQPLYKDASGALYSADGNVYTPGGGGGGAPAAPAPAADTAYDPNAYYQYNAGTGQLKTSEGRPAGNTGLWMK